MDEFMWVVVCPSYEGKRNLVLCMCVYDLAQPLLVLSLFLPFPLLLLFPVRPRAHQINGGGAYQSIRHERERERRTISSKCRVLVANDLHHYERRLWPIVLVEVAQKKGGYVVPLST